MAELSFWQQKDKAKIMMAFMYTVTAVKKVLNVYFKKSMSF